MDYAFDYAVDPINTGLFDIAAETVPTVPTVPTVSILSH